MTHIDPGFVAHQFKRFMRPDWQSFVRPDARRYLRPDAETWLRPEEKLLLGLQRNERKDTCDCSVEIAELLRLKSELAAIKAEIGFRRLLRKAFNPNQLRVPAGNPDGGQWTGDEDQIGRIRLAQGGGTLTDASGNPYYNLGGHHEVPRSTFEKWNLSPETRQVFVRATTGTVSEVGL